MTTTQDFKYHLRMNDLSGDPWGTAMSAFFDVAAEMHNRGLNVPREWRYSASPCGVSVEDALLADIFSEMDNDELAYVGNILHRYTEMLDSKGRSY